MACANNLGHDGENFSLDVIYGVNLLKSVDNVIENIDYSNENGDE